MMSSKQNIDTVFEYREKGQSTVLLGHVKTTACTEEGTSVNFLC